MLASFTSGDEENSLLLTVVTNHSESNGNPLIENAEIDLTIPVLF